MLLSPVADAVHVTKVCLFILSLSLEKNNETDEWMRRLINAVTSVSVSFARTFTFTFMRLWPGSIRREWPGSGAVRALDKKIKCKLDKSK